MARGHAHGAEARDRSHRRTDDGHGAEKLHAGFQARNCRNVGAAQALEGLDAAAAARAVDEPHERQLELEDRKSTRLNSSHRT